MSGGTVRGWATTARGVLHAVNNSRSLCGMRRREWFPADPAARLCESCAATYGVGFPAPPGHVHHSVDVPWFADYAGQRAAVRMSV